MARGDRTSGILVIAMLTAMGIASVRADDVTYVGASGGDWAVDANWSTGAYPTNSDHAYLNSTAHLDSDMSGSNIRGIHIGQGGSGVLNIQAGGSLRSTALASSESHLGHGSGDNGALNQSGGTAEVNYLEIGRGGTGLYSLTGGDLIIARGKSNNSLCIGTDDSFAAAGAGTFEISGGSLTTRTGVRLGSANGSGIGTFSVMGSAPTQIGIGSRNSGDGSWYQSSGSILEVGVDLGGVTKILVDDVDTNDAQFITFEQGALLDVDYYNSLAYGGTWAVMELENGDIVNNGLAFAPGVDTNTWSFDIDNQGSNGVLTVTAQGDPLGIVGNWFVVEAEDYAAQGGTQREACSDTGGGTNVSRISDGNWCCYEDIRLGTNALLNFRVARASGRDDGHIEIRLDATDGTLIGQVDVPETGGWQTWETVSVPVPADDSLHDIYLVFVETSTTNNGSMFNLNWWSRSHRVEAEHFSAGYGWKFEGTSDVGGGQNLGWITDGEWMEYTINVATAGLHTLRFRVASSGGGGSINVVSDGTVIGGAGIADTGGWQEWAAVDAYANFSQAGPQTVRLEFQKGLNLNWFSYWPSIDIPIALTVGDTKKQMMRYGLDYERLWYWAGNLSSSEKDTVAKWSVVDCEIDYIRVAINSKYELDEGDYDNSAYTSKIKPMMQDMKDANPNIKFFASPRPLDEAVSGASWQPYPIWITGASSYTSGDYDFDYVKCSEYLIRYLLLMKSWGFKITYLDVTNEWQSNFVGGRVTQSDVRDIAGEFEAYLADPWPHPALSTNLLLTAEDIPLIVAPSAHNYSEGTSWINNILHQAKRDAINIASCHNTGKQGSADAFAAAVADECNPGTEVWNTELHGWKSTSDANEVLTSSYLWEAIRGGFSGINGWLAIGTTSQGHCYILNPSGTPRRNVKYYIFKKVTTTSNFGRALDIDLPSEFQSTVALVREDLLTVWVANESDVGQFTEIDIGNRTITNPTIQRTMWNETLNDAGVVEGVADSITATSGSGFHTYVDAGCLYCFEIEVELDGASFPFLEAETYTAESGISVLPCADTNSGDMVEFSDAGDEVDFNVDVTRIDTYDVAFRVSSASDNIQFELYDGTNLIATVDRVPTGNAQNWTTVYKTVELMGGNTTLTIKAAGGDWNLNWIKFYQSISPSAVELDNLAEGQTATASNVHSSGYEADKAVDGNRSSRWATSTAPAWLEVDFGTPTMINGVSFYEYGNRTRAYEIQYSDDGVGWSTAFTGGNPADDVIYFFPTVTGNRFRYQSITTTGGPSIYEFMLHYDPTYVPLALSSMAIKSGGLSLSWSGMSGSTYALQYSTNLLTHPFTTIESGIPVHESININTMATPDDAAFYRIILE